MKKFKLLFLMFLTLSCFSQEDTLNLGKEFTFNYEGDSIEGLYFGDNNKSKPLLLFIQGSGLNPLFLSDSLGRKYPLFITSLISEQINLIILSKPGIPRIVELKDLNSNYDYLIGDSIPPKLFSKLNYLDCQVKLHNKCISYLKNNYKYSKLIVAGHSQGARITAELSVNKHVDKIIYMSADPLGRIAVRYDKEYSKFEEHSKAKLKFYNSVFKENNQSNLWGNDTFKTWVSFSKPSLIALSKSEIPTLIVYGTLDKSCPNCYTFSFLPSYYDNISVFKYENYGHNYSDPEGEYHWDIVVKDVYSWILK